VERDQVGITETPDSFVSATAFGISRHRADARRRSLFGLKNV
jgi:hypothetical protein